MKPSQALLSAKRTAIGAERITTREAGKDEPWSVRNVCIWNGIMANALKERNRIILAYIARRRARSA